MAKKKSPTNTPTPVRSAPQQNLLSVRSTALLIVNCTFCNPNGDPDMDGRPRTLINSGQGWMSPVSVKRKIRNIMGNHDSPDFQRILREVGLDAEECHILESLNRGFPELIPVEAVNKVYSFYNDEGEEAFLKRYIDLRLFGTTFLETKKKETESGMRLKRNGPVTISPLVSIAPVNVNEATQTKMAPTDEKKLAEGNGDIAPMAFKVVQHGIYVGMVDVNPNVARHTLTTPTDIELLKKILRYTFSATTSAIRPGGSMEFVHIWWADHTNSLGSFNTMDFVSKLTPRKKEKPNEDSLSIAEYEFPQPDFPFNVIDLAK